MKLLHSRTRSLLLVAIIVLVLLVVAGIVLLGQSTTPAPSATPSPVFSPAHASIGQAVKEFFWIRPTPVQPIQYTHKVHVQQNGMKCTECHVGADKGPQASIPGVSTCMTCHEDTATDKPEIQKLTAYYNRGEDIPWQRVYGFPPISHVRFNHAPHVQGNKVDCLTCHGDIPNMTTAQRAVNQTMGWCVDCHREKKVSNDCMTCHY